MAKLLNGNSRGELRTPPRVPAYFDNRNTTLLQTLDLTVYDLDRFFDEVQFVVNLDFIQWYSKSRFQQSPGEIHWTAVKAILKYLRNTKDMVLMYGEKPKADLKVSCYADPSFQTDKDNTKSQTGYVFVLNGGVVDWKSAKKRTNAMSSTKAKYIAATEASMEVVRMRKFINGLGGVVPLNKRHMEMLCDNEHAIAIANDPSILKGARHFQRKYHYIREVIQELEIVLKKVHTYDNVANPFTTPMPYDKHYEHDMAIGIVPARSLM
ncbi:hypothetical protein Tco_0842433 [Tanacetum coccineum]|uniref:Retrotransposon protein, putative, Ty1-copia subclass n=1 Tax=Tanacetum coccineum TaxID=301880 RepID=A0ABQ5AZ97_9ASTR